MNKATTKVTVAAKKLGKPSQASAKVLANLYPGCSAASKKKFDPYNESVVAEQHHQKRQSLKGKVKTVSSYDSGREGSFHSKGCQEEISKKQ